jgi:hypothetical protein
MLLDLVTTGVDPATTAIPGVLAQAIAGHPGYDVASAADVAALLQLDREKHLLGCTEDSACMAEIGRKMNADFLVRSSLGRIGQTFVLSLAVLDPKDAGSTRKAADSFESLEDVRKGAAGTVARLFGWAVSSASFRLPAGMKSSFAVFDLHASGVSPEVATSLTQVLSSEVKSIEGTTVVSRDDILAMLQFDKQRTELGCTEDTGCMARIGGALGVDRLVVGNVGRIADDFVVTLRLINARAASVESRHTEAFHGTEDQLIGATRHAARALLGIEEPATGRLAIVASHPAGELFLDDVKKGKLPLPPLVNLDAGRHSVRVAKDGFFDWQSDIYVSPLETTAAWAQLRERPEKWYQKWWIWTAAGGIAVGSAIAAIVGTRSATTGQIGITAPPLPAGSVR